MGRPLPGYQIELLDAQDRPAAEGEICLRLDPPPTGLMLGYGDSSAATSLPHERFYHTGDLASRDADGYITYIGRTDDVFKSSDYRISPFELESVLVSHPAVAEAAVVAHPDPIRHTVPKAFIFLAPGLASPGRSAACLILDREPVSRQMFAASSLIVRRWPQATLKTPGAGDWVAKKTFAATTSCT